MAGRNQRAEAAEALLAVSQVMTAIVARSLGNISPTVTVPQLRVLVMLSNRGEMNIGAVAEALGVDPSNASRACDRLTKAGLVARQENPEDRRSVLLTLSRRGQAMVSAMMRQRLEILELIVASMRPADRRQLTAGSRAFLEAIEARPHEELAMGSPHADVLPWLL